MRSTNGSSGRGTACADCLTAGAWDRWMPPRSARLRLIAAFGLCLAHVGHWGYQALRTLKHLHRQPTQSAEAEVCDVRRRQKTAGGA